MLKSGTEVVASAVVDAASSIFSVMAHVNPALSAVCSTASAAVDAVSKVRSADQAVNSLKNSNSTPQERIENFGKTSFALSNTVLATISSLPDAGRLQLSGPTHLHQHRVAMV